MKRWSFGLAVVAMLVLVLTLPAGAPAAPAPHHALPAATAASNAKPPAAAPHPEIRDAMEALRQARGNLDHAAHHFGGHRVAAMKHIDEAMHELQACMKYP
ncbi:MAG TPA: hypothetical protein VFW94_14265 [Candidatus Acidoferrales bacterium]|nr:hypothetical protein [Candidatus Acidoferrales bacterium]